MSFTYKGLSAKLERHIVTEEEVNHQLERLRSLILELLQARDPGISIHDFRMVRGKGHTNLIFDIALPARLMQERKQIKKDLDAALAQTLDSTYYTVVTFDIAAFN